MKTRPICLSDRDIRRFEEKLKTGPRTGCVEWQARKNPSGYGTMNIGGQPFLAHRISWTIARGQIPEGMVIDHVCHNPACCNPEHLRVVTQRQNVLENSSGIAAKNAAKTHCPQGHEYTVENTRARRGKRECRQCDIERSREYHKKRREQNEPN